MNEDTVGNVICLEPKVFNNLIQGCRYLLFLNKPNGIDIERLVLQMVDKTIWTETSDITTLLSPVICELQENGTLPVDMKFDDWYVYIFDVIDLKTGVCRVQYLFGSQDMVINFKEITSSIISIQGN